MSLFLIRKRARVSTSFHVWLRIGYPMINRRGRWLDGKGRGRGWEHIPLLYHQLQMLLQITSLSTSERFWNASLETSSGLSPQTSWIAESLRWLIWGEPFYLFRLLPLLSEKTHADVSRREQFHRMSFLNCSCPVRLLEMSLSNKHNCQQLFQGFLSFPLYHLCLHCSRVLCPGALLEGHKIPVEKTEHFQLNSERNERRSKANVNESKQSGKRWKKIKPS